MTDRYPTLEEFWRRLDRREVEADLQAALRARAARVEAQVLRLGEPATVVAFVEHVLPGSAVPAEVIAGFIESAFDRPMGRGDERSGVLPRAELIPMGFRVLETAGERPFAGLPREQQAAVLQRAERGQVAGPPGFDSGLWFRRTRDLALLGYTSDPRGMVQMGYPGPSYRPGYVWLAYGGPEARNRRKPGHERY